MSSLLHALSLIFIGNSFFFSITLGPSISGPEPTKEIGLKVLNDCQYQNTTPQPDHQPADQLADQFLKDFPNQNIASESVHGQLPMPSDEQAEEWFPYQNIALKPVHEPLPGSANEQVEERFPYQNIASTPLHQHADLVKGDVQHQNIASEPIYEPLPEPYNEQAEEWLPYQNIASESVHNRVAESVHEQVNQFEEGTNNPFCQSYLR